MGALSNLFMSVVSNWKTSSVGLLSIAGGVAALLGVHVAALPAGDPMTLILTGIGLLLAHDGVAPTA